MNKQLSMLLAASVLVTGFTGAFVYAPNAAFGITSVDELTDVDKSSWAYDALRDLVEKYNVIEGYPDKTFRGDHKATRYEMAAALNATIRHIGKDIARLGTEKADKEDLAKLAKLQEEFKAELAALQARTEALEARAAKIEAKNEEQDNRLTVLEKLKIYGDVTFGGFADIGSRGGNGTPFTGQGHDTYTTFGGNWGATPRNQFNAAAPNTYVNPQQTANEGFSDSISAIGRVRVNIDYPIVEDEDGEGVIGEGTLHTRLVGAYGRVSPLLSNGDAGKLGTGSSMLSGVSRIAGDASAFNEGIRTSSLNNNIVTGSNTRANIYLDSAYYTQEFRSGIPILTDLLPGIDLLPDDENWKMSMKMKMGLIPWREIFQQSPYTGDETQQFQNTAMLNNASIPVNATAPTVAFEWHQGLGEWHSIDVKTALSALDVSDAMNALALTYEGSLNYNWGWAADWLDLPGNVYAGGWFIHGRGGSNSLMATATGNAINGATPADAMAMGKALTENPVSTIYNNALSLGVTRNAAGLNAAAAGIGLPAGSLASQAALAASLGVTTAQVTNMSQVLPAATIAAINLTGALGSNLAAGATIKDYMALAARSGGFGAVADIPPGDHADGSYDDNDNAHGFYVGVNQELHRGAGLFFSYGVADTGPQSMLTSALMNGTGRNAVYNPFNSLYGVKSSMNVGVEIPMKALHLPWRHKDVLGVGYAMINPNDAYGSTYSGNGINNLGTVTTGSSPVYYTDATNTFRRAAGSVPTVNPNTFVFDGGRRGYTTESHAEHIIEAYYKVHLNDRFSITPNVQFIINRLGDSSNDLMTVIGLRSSFNF